MVILETQKKPGITPSKMLESNPTFGPYQRLASSKTTQTESRENVTGH